MKPIRCFTCNKVLGNKWCAIEHMRSIENMSWKDIYDKLCITRYCCKKTIMTSIDASDYSNYPDKQCQVRNAYQLSETSDTVNFLLAR